MRRVFIRVSQIAFTSVLLTASQTLAQQLCVNILKSQFDTLKTSEIKTMSFVPPKEVEPTGSTTYRTNEGYFSVAKSSMSARNNISTFGLASCVGLTLYDKTAKVGLVSHFVTAKYDSSTEINEYVKHILEAIHSSGGDLRSIEATLILGGSSMQYTDQITSLIAALNTSVVQRINISRPQSYQPRGLSLNLETGQVSELLPAGRFSWSWSKDHSLELNKPNLSGPN